ncbi:MAG: hypothetical protein AAF763_15925 [Pseudomonadota bacterium]
MSDETSGPQADRPSGNPILDWWREGTTGVILHSITAAFLLLKLLTEKPGVRSGIAWIFAGVAALWILRSLTVGRAAGRGGRLPEPWARRCRLSHYVLLGAVGATAVKGLIPGWTAAHWIAIYVATLAMLAHWGFVLWRDALDRRALAKAEAAEAVETAPDPAPPD